MYIMGSSDRFRSAKGTIITANIQQRANGYTSIAIPPAIVAHENLRKGGKIRIQITGIAD